LLAPEDARAPLFENPNNRLRGLTISDLVV